MLCGCTNPVEPRATPATPDVTALRKGLDDGRRLVVPSSPSSSLRHCFSVRVRPSSASAGVTRTGRVETTQSDESLGLGAEAQVPPRMRSYTLTDGATSAIGRILTCFQDNDASSDERPRSRPRSRSLWSRRRSPSSCLPTSSPAAASGGCIVDVVLDCSPGTVRRRRLEAQSVASTSSTLQSDSVWKPTTQGSEASCELTGTSSERLLHYPDHPVWERRQEQGAGRRPTEPARQRPPRGPHPQSTPVSDIPRPRDCSGITQSQHDRSTTPRTPDDSTRSRRRVARRATTSAIPRPQVRVVQSASSGGGGQLTVTESRVSVKPTTSCPVSWWLECGCFSSRFSLNWSGPSDVVMFRGTKVQDLDTSFSIGSSSPFNGQHLSYDGCLEVEWDVKLELNPFRRQYSSRLIGFS